jgi:hypothetical protein
MLSPCRFQLFDLLHVFPPQHIGHLVLPESVPGITEVGVEDVFGPVLWGWGSFRPELTHDPPRAAPSDRPVHNYILISTGLLVQAPLNGWGISVTSDAREWQSIL